MKRLLSLALSLAMVASLAACGGGSSSTADAPDTQEAPPAAEETAAEEPEDTEPEPEAGEEEPAGDAAAEDVYIAVVSKGFQHQFWQTVYAGSQDAAAKYGVEMTFEGPASESDISDQVDMVNAALAKNPTALALAALDTESLYSQLEDAAAAGIPVVGFDSGVPDAPAGSIVSTASTDNYEAGALAADEMWAHPDFAAAIDAATADAPVAIAVQSQDATSASILGRTNGFLDRMFELVEGKYPGAVEITGHDVFNRAASDDVAVSIKVTVPPTTSYTDAQSAAQAMLQNNANLIGYFTTNEASVTGLLAATNDGTDLDPDSGIYSDIVVIGFDAGAPLKAAVASGYFYGAVAQDAYMIGYLAVELAYKAVIGESIDEMVDTGCKFYTADNMDEADIAQLLYD